MGSFISRTPASHARRTGAASTYSETKVPHRQARPAAPRSDAATPPRVGGGSRTRPSTDTEGVSTAASRCAGAPRSRGRGPGAAAHVGRGKRRGASHRQRTKRPEHMCNYMFYKNPGTRLGTYCLDDIHSWFGLHGWLERRHDFIQWLFPTLTASALCVAGVAFVLLLRWCCKSWLFVLRCSRGIHAATLARIRCHGKRLRKCVVTSRSARGWSRHTS